ncbi:MAG: DUF3791 domain-containing protein [Lachnospiraceae bacterium]|nr:DUF3791 domain-containing protein [Lachnospiraceae bacterium]
MVANPVLLQKKYARIIIMFAKVQCIAEEESLDFFYNSRLYKEISEGISDMHCRSDEYLVEELKLEFYRRGRFSV